MDGITFPENLYTTSGLSILLYGVISPPDATSYDKIFFSCFSIKTYVVCAQKNRLNETVLLSIQNICLN